MQFIFPRVSTLVRPNRLEYVSGRIGIPQLYNLSQRSLYHRATGMKSVKSPSTVCMYTNSRLLSNLCSRHVTFKPPGTFPRTFQLTSRALSTRLYCHIPSSLSPWYRYPCVAPLGLLGYFRLFSTQQGRQRAGPSPWSTTNRTTVTYMVAIAITIVGLSYAAVPLYRIFCQASGYGGTVNKIDASEKIGEMEPIREREITIRFNADTSAAMQWQFKPHQREIKLVPGETALAFYTARNPTDRAVTGIATYNVIPFEAGLYFNKIQCFCFEEQRLNPREQVDMPVFFYIDPEFNEDPQMAKVDTITLSYTFFEAKEGEQIQLPLPNT